MMAKISHEDHLNHLTELQEANRKRLVSDFIWDTFNDKGIIPETLDIQEHFEHIYLDDRLVNDEREKALQQYSL